MILTGFAGKAVCALATPGNAAAASAMKSDLHERDDIGSPSRTVFGSSAAPVYGNREHTVFGGIIISMICTTSVLVMHRRRST
jgi:hypothetical protein